MKLLKQFCFLFVIFSGFVLGDFESDFVNTFGYVFGEYSADFIFLKLMLWIFLFAILFWSLFRVVFEDNRAVSAIIAFVISTIGVRFIPDVFLEYIGQGFYVFLLLIVLLIPWFVLSKVMGFSLSKSKFNVILYLIAYGAIIYGVFLMGGVSFEGEILSKGFDFLREYPWIYIVVFVIIGGYLISKLKN
jgi:hypothetical protein